MKYRILIFGAGAIGTYLGASLILQGHRVVFIEREKDRRQLRERGLIMELGGQVFKLPNPEVISDLAGIQPGTYDLAILALKTYHLQEILPEMARIQDRLPPLLCLTNGVESERILRRSLERVAVIPGTVTSAVDRRQKGDVVVERPRGVGLAGDHDLIPGLLAEFQAGGLNPRYYPRAEDMKWSKLIINLLGNCSSAILDMTPAEIYQDPGLFRLEKTQILEALQVMRRLDISPVDLPGVPVRLLVLVLRHVPEILARPLLVKFIGGGRGQKMPSFHGDLHSGKGKSEVDQLNGAVVRAGREAGCPTPVNELLSRTLTALLKGRENLDTYRHHPRALLDKLTIS